MSLVTVILSKDLQVSTVHRLAIEYRDKSIDTSRPRSLFLKLCKPLPGEPLGLARAEIEFYQTAATEMSCPPLVRHYAAEFHEESGRSHLLLEDLTETHSQPEQTHAPSEELSRLAIEALAKAHATCWDRSISDVGIVPAKKFDDEWLRHFVKHLHTSVMDFSKVAALTAKQKDAYRKMLANAERIWGRLTDRANLTVTHGDLHWWNFLYPKNASTHDVRLFDWQLWHIDLAARDLAFLLALGGFAEPRPSLETELLRVYHDALGVPDYSWEMLLEDYRWSAIRNLNVPVIFWSQGKHESTWQTALRRAWDSYEQMECSGLM